MPTTLPTEDSLTLALARSGLCDGLPAEAVERLALAASASRIEGGGILYEDKDLADAVYVVAEGEVSFLLRAAPHTEFVEAARIGAGQFFGEGAVLDRLVARETGRDAHPSPSTGRKARIMCRDHSLVLQIPAAALGGMLQEFPIQLASNLLRHSAEKSRNGVQRMFDEVIDRETRRIFTGVVRWLTRHTEDAVTSLRLDGDLLQKLRNEETRAEILADTAATAADFGATLKTLSHLTGEQQPTLAWETINLRTWWESVASELQSMAAARHIHLDSYVEDFPLVSSWDLLTRTVRSMLEGVTSLGLTGDSLELKIGRNFGTAEFHLTAQIPGLTEFTALRLFQPFALREEDQDCGVTLALARRYARLLGGDVTVKRRSGERLTLALSLPLHHSDASAAL